MQLQSFYWMPEIPLDCLGPRVWMGYWAHPPGGISKVQVGRVAGDEATGRGTGDRGFEGGWCNLLRDLTKRVHPLAVGR